jgi:hypothetical protein
MNMEDRSPGSGYGLEHSPDTRHQEVPDETADLVLQTWQELVGAVLSPARAERFRGHPGLAALCCFSQERRLAAGSDLYRRTGQLLLAEWVCECAWRGGAAVSLDWAEVAAGDPDAAIAARDMLAAAVASIQWERARSVMAQRLVQPLTSP